MVNKKDYMKYAKSMKDDGMQPMNFKQYKYSHAGSTESRSNTPINVRAKKIKKMSIF